MSEYRDINAVTAPGSTLATGRKVIAVIGIDRYQRWGPLANAVSDANGARSLFRRLGFEEVRAPLFDEHATERAIHTLVTDELTSLDENDSLILFYAGHGGTRVQRVGDKVVKTGYLVPVDAANEPNRVATWIGLEDWLRRVSMLPPKHILVILDACHSGIALSQMNKWGRDAASSDYLPLSAFQARRSRVIITSALDDQIARDSGPIPGHSLFTGCLIQGLTGGLAGKFKQDDRWVTTGKDLGAYVRSRVVEYSDHARHGQPQTPDFGTFDLDDRGEMVIPLLLDVPAIGHSPAGWPPAVAQSTVPRPSVSPDPTMPWVTPRPQHHDPRFTTSPQPANPYGRPPAEPHAKPYGPLPQPVGYPLATDPYARKRQESPGGALHDLAHELPPSAPMTILRIPIARLRELSVQRKTLFCAAVVLFAASVIHVLIPTFGNFEGLLLPLISGGTYLVFAAIPAGIRTRVSPMMLQAIPLGVAWAGVFVLYRAGFDIVGIFLGIVTLGYLLLVFGQLARLARPPDRIARIIGVIGAMGIAMCVIIATWFDRHPSSSLVLILILLSVLCVALAVRSKPAPWFAAGLILFPPLCTLVIGLYVSLYVSLHDHISVETKLLLRLAHIFLRTLAYFGVLLVLSPAAYEEAIARFARRNRMTAGG